MILPLLLQLAGPSSAIEAERAMAVAAQAEGHQAALRRFAAPDAVIFAPEPSGVTDALASPFSGVRQPTSSATSCDGGWAAISGLTTYPDGKVGNFTTIWVRRSDGRWQWTVSDGAMLKDRPVARAELAVRRAACPTTLPAGTFPAIDSAGTRTGIGRSRDGTLGYQWSWTGGDHLFRVGLWNGVAWDIVVLRRTPAPMRP